MWCPPFVPLLLLPLLSSTDVFPWYVVVLSPPPMSCCFPSDGHWLFRRYGALGAASCGIQTTATILITFGSIAASRHMHRRLLGGILGAAMPFFDVEPSGRILNRFIKDLARVDETVSMVRT